MAKRVHHPLLGEVDSEDGPILLQDEGIAAPPEPPDPTESPPIHDSDDGFEFPAPDPFPPTSRERIKTRLRAAGGRARTIAARSLRMLAAHLEKP